MGKQSTAESEVPVLTRVWCEDGVWNICAFDLPVVAYAEDFDAARKNFEEALGFHFEGLASLQKSQQVVSKLKAMAKERGFYEERIRPHELVEKFVVPHKQEPRLSAAS